MDDRSRLNVWPINDPIAIGRIYASPNIARVGHDHMPAGPVMSVHAQYWQATVDGEACGGFLSIAKSSIEADVHALLWPNALAHGRELGLLWLGIMFESPRWARLTAQVMETIPTAVNYCLKMGFEREGFKPDCCLKDGKLIGVHILGLTRRQWHGIHR